MSASCRLAIGATKVLENSAAPRIARRTFASSSNSTATSRTTTHGSLRCLRETQRTVVQAGEAASGLRGQIRSFSQSASRGALKTIDQIKARNKGGVCSASFRPEHWLWISSLGDYDTNKSPSRSTLQPPSSSSQPVVECGPTSHTRRSAWRGSG